MALFDEVFDRWVLWYGWARRQQEAAFYLVSVTHGMAKLETERRCNCEVVL